MSSTQPPQKSLYNLTAEMIVAEGLFPPTATQAPTPAPAVRAPRAEPVRQWRNTEPGVLAWVGTRWRIHYEPSSRHPDFVLYEDQRHITSGGYIDQLKHCAETRQKELDAIGME